MRLCKQKRSRQGGASRPRCIPQESRDDISRCLSRVRWREAFLEEPTPLSRPRKNADSRRSRQIIFRLTAAEYDQLSALAERAGLTPNELARRLARRARKRLVVRTLRRCDPAFLQRLDRIGQNLNQLVKNAHIFGRISPRVEMLALAIDEIVARALEEADDGS